VRGEREEEGAEEQHHPASILARTHHSRPAATRRSGARTKQQTGAGGSSRVRRAGAARLVGSRPGRGAGAAASIDGPERALRGRARAAAPRAAPSNLGRCLHTATSVVAVSEEQGGGFAENGGGIRGYGPGRQPPIDPRSGGILVAGWPPSYRRSAPPATSVQRPLWLRSASGTGQWRSADRRRVARAL
jgi:hypothetical protein